MRYTLIKTVVCNQPHTEIGKVGVGSTVWTNEKDNINAIYAALEGYTNTITSICGCVAVVKENMKYRIKTIVNHAGREVDDKYEALFFPNEGYSTIDINAAYKKLIYLNKYHPMGIYEVESI